MTSIKKLEDLWMMNAAGMVKKLEDVRALVRAPLSHIVVGSITIEPRAGNPEPTFWPSPDGRWALNSRGLPGPGCKYYEQHGRAMAKMAYDENKKLVASITAMDSLDEWKRLACTASLFADVVEVNASCPNKWKDGKNAGLLADDPETLIPILGDIRSHVGWHIAIWLKLPPYRRPRTSDTLKTILSMIGNSGLVDAIVSCNTIGGQKPPIIDGKPVISMPTAGMSGARIKSWSLLQNRVIGEIAPHIPRIGVGGIRSGPDVEQYRLAGVSGVAIGTEFFKTMDPRIFSDVLAEIA
ncbi:MAG: hypothetical protein RLZZ342_121 [Candidatus Parcubacteria bacterium]